MKKTIHILVLLAALTPVFAYAQIESTTEAEAGTGGNSAGSGGTVETGPSSSEVKTTTIGGESGSVKIEAKASTNGNARTETVEKEISGGANVNVKASSNSGGVKVESREDGKVTVTVHGTGTPIGFWSRIPLPTWFSRPGVGSESSEMEQTIEIEVRDEAETRSPFRNLYELFQKLFNFFTFF
ncbi:hypothetical protein C4585_02165 [Candidatus Parcubacteria bacterium]|nr:MAG: hypothetical protein C4585_02165 [Candidatus Parcubacteria bacterium]